MALNIVQATGTTTIPGFMDIVNNNFTELQNATENFLDIYDTSTGNLDVSINPVGQVKAKKVLIPLGNAGLIVGNTEVTDNAVSTKTVYSNVYADLVTSLQTKSFAVNATGASAIAIAGTTRTLILDPTASGLTFDISSSVSSAMVDLYIINMSTASNMCGLNITSNFIDQSSMTKINIPYKKNLHLRYLNNAATSTAGWYLVCHNGCTII